MIDRQGLLDNAGRFQLIICSTTSEERVLLRSEVEAIRGRQAPDSNLLILDLAVPRDVEPEAGELKGVELLDIDHLGGVITENMSRREVHRPKAELVVERGVRELVDELRGRGAGPVIAALVDRAEEVRQGELKRAISKMRPLDDAERVQLERLTQAIAAKLMHQPINFLRQHAEDRDRRRVLEEAFGLSVDESSEGA